MLAQRYIHRNEDPEAAGSNPHGGTFWRMGELAGSTRWDVLEGGWVPVNHPKPPVYTRWHFGTAGYAPVIPAEGPGSDPGGGTF